MLRPKPIPVSLALRKVVESGDRARLEKALQMIHPADLARVLPQITAQQRSTIVEVLMKLRKAGATLSEIPGAQLRDILNDLDDSVVVEVVKRLPPDDAVDLIQDLPEERSSRILNGLNISEATELRELLLYSPESAGGLMTTEFFSLQESDTTESAVKSLRVHGSDQGMYYLYVTDQEGRLKGLVTLHQLLLSSPATPIKDFMNEQVYTVNPKVPQEEAARMIAHYNLIALPVVDDVGVMLGVITIDDIVDVIQEEATEDIYLMAGLSQDDRVFTSWNNSVRLRLPWLTVNLVTAILASRVVAMFEPTLAKFAWLAVFMPIVPGMGGNAATQTITVIVRALALGELSPGNTSRVVLKEMIVGVINGIVTGIMGAIIAYFWVGNVVLGLVLGLAMVINNIVAAMAGTLIPLSLRAARLDPAIASSIFVTTFTDVFGFLSFLGLATLFLQYLV
jgi:magnesium transporter